MNSPQPLPVETRNGETIERKSTMKTLVILAALAFTSGAHADHIWQKFGNCSDDYCTYIDLSAKTGSVDGIINGVTILGDYVSISSAQMFGLSEVERVSFDCAKSRSLFGTSDWYEDRMARGKKVKTLPSSAKWVPIPYNYRNLFAKVCTAG
jgi:hypothetical protein